MRASPRTATDLSKMTDEEKRDHKNKVFREWRAQKKKSDPEWWEKQNEIKRKWATETEYYKKRDILKTRAQRILQYHVRIGNIVRQDCEVCGIPKGQAHHEDYSKPLEVRWLCPQHHQDVHRGILCI